MGCLQHATHGDEHLIYIISVNPHSKPEKIASTFTHGRSDTQRSYTLPKVIKLVSGGAGILTWVIWWKYV